MVFVGKVCARGLWDETIPGIEFDENGVSNYAKLFDKLCEAYPRGEKGEKYFDEIIKKIKIDGKGKRYDCIIGVSGGTDSSYLMYLAKEKYKLRPLAVTFDNGWTSEIAVQNIKRVTKALNIDLETYVVDYEEMKSIHKAYMHACLPWIDMPTDFAIKSVLFLTAKKERISYILSGHDFRSEGTQPNEWTHGDSKQLKYIVKKFSDMPIKTLPFISYFTQIYFSLVKGIQIIKPYYFLEYQKKTAQSFLKQKFNWEYYGGHHHENIFTKFAIAYWMYKKFGIDKRKITFSAQILSGEISRDEAIKIINQPPLSKEDMENLKLYTLKKLGLNLKEFEKLWNNQNKSIYDYPSYLTLITKFSKVFKTLIKSIYQQKPTFVFQLENRKK